MGAVVVGGVQSINKLRFYKKLLTWSLANLKCTRPPVNESPNDLIF